MNKQQPKLFTQDSCRQKGGPNHIGGNDHHHPHPPPGPGPGNFFGPGIVGIGLPFLGGLAVGSLIGNNNSGYYPPPPMQPMPPMPYPGYPPMQPMPYPGYPPYPGY